MLVSPSRSPGFSTVKLPAKNPSIAARCAAVTSPQVLMPRTSSTILSRICGVRSQTGVEVEIETIPPNSGSTSGGSADLTRA